MSERLQLTYSMIMVCISTGRLRMQGLLAADVGTGRRGCAMMLFALLMLSTSDLELLSVTEV